ncbi:MAG: 2-oxo acid dehydrogenase subunit E2 [Phycisphaerales bacterium]|nr:2-oxo acid dehydrogenase subunit E2 [Phycisphaerales bacterium]
MAEVIRMPLLSDTMTEGKIAEWHKKVGDSVKADDVLADVETDKATMEVLPFVSGIILYIGVEKGKAAKVNDIIAIIGKAGEDYTALLDSPKETLAAVATAPAALVTDHTSTASVAPAAIPAGVTVIRMPLLSDTMTEGKIVAWNKKVGDTVKNDDVLADVETDKATMEVMGYADGVLLHIGVAEGNAAKVNDIIAIVGKAGTDIQGILNAANSAAPSVASLSSAASAAELSDDSRIKISPLARKIAEGKGIDLKQLQGSGDGGRIVKRDIENYPDSAAFAAKATTTSSPVFVPTTGIEGHTDTPLTQMRKIIAARLSESMYSAPHFYLKISVAMDQAMAARKQINDMGEAKISFNDFIVKACAMALRKHPAVNSSWMGDFIRTHHHINVGSAIAVEEGLIVPVIKYADQLSLTQIATTASDLYAKARNKKIQPSEFTGNTFTISNLGMMGIDEFTAIINPPDSCILAVGNIVPTPVVENGTVVVRQILKLTLSCDHRVVDGAIGAQFLQTLKSYLENPVTMLA